MCIYITDGSYKYSKYKHCKIFKYKHHDIHYYESLKKITNLRDKKQVTVKFLQEILHKAGLNYGKRKRNDLIKLVAPLWQGVHKITNDKRYKL